MSAFDCFERVGTDDGGNSFFIFHSNCSPKFIPEPKRLDRAVVGVQLVEWSLPLQWSTV